MSIKERLKDVDKKKKICFRKSNEKLRKISTVYVMFRGFQAAGSAPVSRRKEGPYGTYIQYHRDRLCLAEFSADFTLAIGFAYGHTGIHYFCFLK